LAAGFTVGFAAAFAAAFATGRGLLEAATGFALAAGFGFGFGGACVATRFLAVETGFFGLAPTGVGVGSGVDVGVAGALGSTGAAAVAGVSIVGDMKSSSENKVNHLYLNSRGGFRGLIPGPAKIDQDIGIVRRVDDQELETFFSCAVPAST
jgi:hypothetical protein